MKVKVSDLTLSWLEGNQAHDYFEDAGLPTKWAGKFVADGITTDDPTTLAKQLRVWSTMLSRATIGKDDIKDYTAVRDEIRIVGSILGSKKNPAGSCPKCGNAWHECECKGKSMRKNPTSLASVTRGLHESEADFLARAKRLAEGMGYVGVDFGDKPYRKAKFLKSNPKTGAGYRKRWPYSLELTASEWNAVSFFRGRYDWADALRDADDVTERANGSVMLHFTEASASSLADALREESPSVAASFRDKLDDFVNRIV